MKKIITSILIMTFTLLILSVPFIATAAVYEEVPDDLLLDPRPLGTYSNWFYIQFSSYTLDGDILSGTHQKFYCSQNPLNLNIFNENGPTFSVMHFSYVGMMGAYNKFTPSQTPEEGFYQELLSTGTATNHALINVGEDYYVRLEKLLYGGNITVKDYDGNDMAQIGASQLDPIIDDINLGVKILLPENNFSQSQIDEMITTFSYKVPCASHADAEKITIKADGYTPGTGEELYKEFDVIDGYAYGLYKIGGNIGFGEGREIKITVTDPYGKKWTDVVTVHCYQGFVDEDGDGEDDRSYDDFWAENPDNYNNQKPDVNLTDLQSMLTGIRGFFESLWGIVPQPIFIVLIGGIMLLIAVGILRAVLG